MSGDPGWGKVNFQRFLSSDATSTIVKKQRHSIVLISPFLTKLFLDQFQQVAVVFDKNVHLKRPNLNLGPFF